MIPVAIFAFLTGAVLALGFRVWILVPFTLLAIIGILIVQMLLGAGFVTAVLSSLVLGLAPQLGYAFGLLARGGLVMLRSPRKRAIFVLGKQRSITELSK
jgi:hypothetical protein